MAAIFHHDIVHFSDLGFELFGVLFDILQKSS